MTRITVGIYHLCRMANTCQGKIHNDVKQRWLQGDEAAVNGMKQFGDFAAERRAILRGNLRCGAVQCGAVRCYAFWCRAVWCIAVWCSAVNCGAVWRSEYGGCGGCGGCAQHTYCTHEPTTQQRHTIRPPTTQRPRPRPRHSLTGARHSARRLAALGRAHGRELRAAARALR